MPFLTGTDTGFAVTPYGEWHAKELELFVADLGFTPAAALRAATEINGRFMSAAGISGCWNRAAPPTSSPGTARRSPISGLLQDKRRLRAVYIGGKEYPDGRPAVTIRAR